MNDDMKLDKVLKASVTKDYEPSEELNRAIIKAAVMKDDAKIKAPARRFSWSKVLVVSLCVVAAGSLGVYAANKAVSKVSVTPHAISVGNTDYVIDEAIATMDVTEPQDPKYKTEYKDYKTYAEADKATGLGMQFSKEYELKEDVTYSITKSSDYTFEDLSAEFVYKDGSFEMYNSRHGGNVASDAAYSVMMHKTSNQRTYEAKTGVSFELVDDEYEGKKSTYVVVAFGETRGDLKFMGLKDKEIHEILDTLIVGE